MNVAHEFAVNLFDQHCRRLFIYSFIHFSAFNHTASVCVLKELCPKCVCERGNQCGYQANSLFVDISTLFLMHIWMDQRRSSISLLEIVYELCRNERSEHAQSVCSLNSCGMQKSSANRSKGTLHKKFISFTFVFIGYFIFASKMTGSLPFLSFLLQCTSVWVKTEVESHAIFFRFENEHQPSIKHLRANYFLSKKYLFPFI